MPAMFIGDAVALDFLNSVATPSKDEVDWLADDEGLLAWLEQAELLTQSEIEDVRRLGAAAVGRAAMEARTLREWFREFVRSQMGRPLDPLVLAQLQPLNEILRRDAVFFKIVETGSEPGGSRKLSLESNRAYVRVRDVMQPIAHALAEFVCTEDFAHVKACEGHRCTLLFADHTRNRQRRFCSTAVCGNRAKVAAFRARAKEAAINQAG